MYSGLPRTNPASGPVGLELGASGFQVRRSKRSATLKWDGKHFKEDKFRFVHVTP